MFDIDPSPTFPFTAEIAIPGSDSRLELKLIAKHKTRKEARAWVASAVGRQDDEFLDEILAGWTDVASKKQGGEWDPIAYSREALSSLLDKYPSAGEAIFDAYMAELFQARLKN